MSVSYDHALSSEDNHDEAAKKLAAKLGWEGTASRGGGLRGKGNVYVFHGRGAEIVMPPGTRKG